MTMTTFWFSFMMMLTPMLLLLHCLRRTREGGQVGGESPHRWQLGLVGGGAGNRRNINIFRL